MIQINNWMEELTNKLKKTFGNNLIFVGLQGSYQRGEAHKDSDIDVVVIFNQLTIDSLKLYKDIIFSMQDYKKACGFVGDCQTLKNWPRHELFQFEKDTRDIYGELKPLLPEIERNDIIESVKISASGIYHACCHTFIHNLEYSEELKGFYKSAFFLLQAVHYLQSGDYISSKNELLPLLTKTDQQILLLGMNPDIQEYGENNIKILIEWAGELLKAEFD